MASLKNTTAQGRAAFASYLSAALIVNIPSNAETPAQATFHHEGTAGFWYIIFARTTGPTTTLYSRKIAAGEPFTEENMPLGDIYALADGSVDGVLSWYVGYRL